MKIAAAKPLPLYEQVKQYLLNRIAAGNWQDGGRIPSEYELMETLGASRMTVHRALREMSSDGLLHRVQGVGTFIRKQTPRSGLLEIHDISEDISRRGHQHTARVLRLQAIRADAAIAAELDLKNSAKVFYSEIVHTENGVPVQLEERFVSPAFAPLYLEQDYTLQTPNRYLQNIAAPTEIEHVIHAMGANARTKALLEIGPEEHCLVVTRRTWIKARPVTRSILIHPGSRYSLASRYEVADWVTKKAAN